MNSFYSGALLFRMGTLWTNTMRAIFVVVDARLRVRLEELRGVGRLVGSRNSLLMDIYMQGTTKKGKSLREVQEPVERF